MFMLLVVIVSSCSCLFVVGAARYVKTERFGSEECRLSSVRYFKLLRRGINASMHQYASYSLSRLERGSKTTCIWSTATIDTTHLYYILPE